MREIILTYLFYWVGSVALFAQNSPIETHLTVKVQVPTVTTFSLSYLKELITCTPITQTFDLQENKAAAFSFMCAEPTVVTIHYANASYDVYVEPGDDMYVGFEGNKFPNSLLFTGKGSLHNAYLMALNTEFEDQRYSVITHKMHTFSPGEYKLWLRTYYNKRRLFFDNYDSGYKKQFSETFRQYALAENDFWYAQHLLRNRYERIRNIAGVLELAEYPHDYFDFLNQIILNNDLALINSNYRDFIQYFLDYRRKYPDSPYGVNSRQVIFRVNAPKCYLLPTREATEIKEELQIGTRLWYLGDQKNYMNDNQDGQITYALFVRTDDGHEGWVMSGKIEQESVSLNTSPQSIEQVECTQENIVKTYRCNRQTWLVNSPLDQNNPIVIFPEEELEYLYENTDQRYTLEASPERYYGVFLKVRTKTGKIGWVVDFSVTAFEQQVAARKKQTNVLNKTVFKEIDRYFYAKSRYYTIARELYLAFFFEQPKAIEPEITQFFRENTVNAYGKTLNDAYVEYLKKIPDANSTPLRDCNLIRKLVTNLHYPPEKIVLEKADGDENKATQPLLHFPVATQAAQQEAVGTLPALSYQPKMPTLKETKFRGHIDQPNGQTLELTLFIDDIAPRYYSYRLALDAKGDFQQTFQLANAVRAELYYGASHVNLFIEPEDDLVLQAKAMDFLNTANFGGKGGHHNNFLALTQRVFSNYYAALETNTKLSNPMDFKDFMEQAWRQRRQYLADYPLRKEFSAAFFNYADADIDYWYGYGLLNYPWAHPVEGEKRPMDVPPIFYSFIDKDILLNKENALASKNYIDFLKRYLDNLLLNSRNKDKITLVETAFKDKIVAYAKAFYLADACREQLTLNIANEVNRYVNSNVPTPYKDALSIAYSKNVPLKQGMPAPNFNLTTLEDKTFSLSEHKGKVICIEFWATWCIPCQEAMKSAQRLREKLSNNTVEFVFINADQDKSAADIEKHLTRLKLKDGVQLLDNQSNPYITPAKDLYGAFQLPLSILIDKNGNIDTYPANKLSETELAARIQELANKK